MFFAHKIAPDLNEAQESYFARACGTARFAYKGRISFVARRPKKWNVGRRSTKQIQTGTRRATSAFETTPEFLR
jgi:putative transposase